MFNWKSVSVVCLSVFLCWNCVKKKSDEVLPDDPNSGTNVTSRQDMLVNYADNIILPAYANFKLKLDTLVIKSNAFTANPDSTSLANFRKAWEVAYIEWQKVEMFDLGPTSDYSLHSYFNVFPTRVTQNDLGAGIEENIVSGTANLDLPATSATQGFPALDYLLFGTGTETELLAKYTSDTDASKRLAYVKKITDKMNSIFTLVHSEWKNTYRSRFVNSTSVDAGSSTSLLVNGIVRHYEKYIRSGKFGIPSGAMVSSGGIAYPEKVEAYYSKNISLILAKTSHSTYIDFFNGKSVITGQNGASLKSYLDGLNAKDSKTNELLSTAINSQFATANSKMNLLANNLYQETISNKQAMQDVYTAMQSAVRMLKVDMTSAMSITITYTDTDGD